MAMIHLSTGGFQPIPEGTHIFRIEAVEYDKDFGQIRIELKTADGKSHRERYNLMRADGTTNDGAMNAFSFFAKTALNNFEVTDIDTEELVGHFVKADVVHRKVDSTKNPGEKTTVVNLGKVYSAEGFGDDAAPAQKPVVVAGDVSSALDALLG